MNNDTAVPPYLECDGGCGVVGYPPPFNACTTTASSSSSTATAPKQSSTGTTNSTTGTSSSIMLKRCSKCNCMYYCSVECQRKHWTAGHKKFCRHLSSWLVKTVPAIQAMGALNATETTPVAVNSACGICLEEPIPNGGVVLSKCRHAFCLPCLQSWQRFHPSYDPNDVEGTMVLPTTSKACPYCRKKMDKPAHAEILEVACLHAARARTMHQGSTDHANDTNASATVATETTATTNTRRRHSPQKDAQFYYDLALKEVDKVLGSDANQVTALYVQSQILVDIRPLDAIAALQRALQLDGEAFTERSAVDEQLATAMAAMTTGNIDEFNRIMAPIMARYDLNTTAPPQYHGKGPYRLFPVYILLGQAQEAANLWQDAHDTYVSMMETVMAHFDNVQVDIYHSVMIWSGMSRCAFQWNLFNEAIAFGKSAVEVDRQHQGVHKLVALPQRAIAMMKQGRQGTSCMGDGSSGGIGYKFGMYLDEQTAVEHTTWSDAICTLRRAIAYEAPWDEDNRRANQALLEQFLEEKDATEAHHTQSMKKATSKRKPRKRNAARNGQGP